MSIQVIHPRGEADLALPAVDTAPVVWILDRTFAWPKDSDLDGALSPEERTRLESFASPHRQTQFLRGRFVVRTVLGARLNTPACDVPLLLSPGGYPSLATGTYCFSLSHSENLLGVVIEKTEKTEKPEKAAMARTNGSGVGIDIERIRPLTEMDRLMQRFFHPSESKWVRAAAPEVQLRRFFEIWTTKEAWSKAHAQPVAQNLAALNTLLIQDSVRYSINVGPEAVATVCFSSTVPLQC